MVIRCLDGSQGHGIGSLSFDPKFSVFIEILDDILSRSNMPELDSAWFYSLLMGS